MTWIKPTENWLVESNENVSALTWITFCTVMFIVEHLSPKVDETIHNKSKNNAPQVVTIKALRGYDYNIGSLPCFLSKINGSFFLGVVGWLFNLPWCMPGAFFLVRRNLHSPYHFSIRKRSASGWGRKERSNEKPNLCCIQLLAQ